MINDFDNDDDKHFLWKMIEQEPGVYKIQSLGTNGYLQVTESADRFDRFIVDDQTTGAYD